MTTRTEKIAGQLTAWGIKNKVTAQITYEADGEIELTGTKYSVQVGDDYMMLVENVGTRGEPAIAFYESCNTIQRIREKLSK